MSKILEILGLDEDELDWQDLALCRDMDRELFYDEYEADENIANMVDEACLSCPVFTQCLQRGIENSEWGVWGAIYLVNGRVDESKNSHKSPDTWNAIKERLGGESIL